MTSWKTLFLLMLLSMSVGALLMRFWPKPMPPTTVCSAACVDSLRQQVERYRRVADSALRRAQIYRLHADSAAQRTAVLLQKTANLQTELRTAVTVRDSNVVLTRIVGSQQETIATQATEIRSLRMEATEQQQALAAITHTRDQLQTTVQEQEAGLRRLNETVATQIRDINKLEKRISQGERCFVFKCPSRGTMYLAGIATAGTLAITINAIK